MSAVVVMGTQWGDEGKGKIVDYLAEKVDRKYSLAIIAAKRARELVDNAPKLVETNSNKPVSIAMEEIGQDGLSYETTKGGIK